MLPTKAAMRSLTKFDRLGNGRIHDAQQDALYPDYLLLGPDMSPEGTVMHIVNSDFTDLYSILTDTSRDPEAYDTFYDKAMEIIAKKARTPSKLSQDSDQLVLESVYDAIRQSMKTISSDESIARIRSVEPDKSKVPLVLLSAFMRNGIGASEHQSLACATVLHRFIDSGILRGTVSIESASRKLRNKPDAKREDYSWVRFTDERGYVRIIDPAHNFFGGLSLSIYKSDRDYLRSEDAENSYYFNKVVDVINHAAEKEHGKIHTLGHAVKRLGTRALMLSVHQSDDLTAGPPTSR